MLYLLSVLLLLGVSQKAFISIRKVKEKHALAKAWECQPAREYPLFDKMLGLDFSLRTMRLISRIKNIPAALIYHKKYSSTFHVVSLGKDIFYTIDPQNLAVIYQAKGDWGVEAHRLKAMRPLCGSGHITSDGVNWERANALLKPSLTPLNAKVSAAFEAAASELLACLPLDGRTIDISPKLDDFVRY